MKGVLHPVGRGSVDGVRSCGRAGSAGQGQLAAFEPLPEDEDDEDDEDDEESLDDEDEPAASVPEPLDDELDEDSAEVLLFRLSVR